MLRSTITSASPATFSTTASRAAAVGSYTSPSVPTCTISTRSGNVASAASGVSPGTDVPST